MASVGSICSPSASGGGPETRGHSEPGTAVLLHWVMQSFKSGSCWKKTVANLLNQMETQQDPYNAINHSQLEEKSKSPLLLG